MCADSIMQFYRHLSQLKKSTAKVRAVTVGAYDGIHIGHQEILRQLRAQAEQVCASTVVLSFEPPPRECFSPAQPAARLTRFRERYELLSRLGVDEFF